MRETKAQKAQETIKIEVGVPDPRYRHPFGVDKGARIVVPAGWAVTLVPADGAAPLTGFVADDDDASGLEHVSGSSVCIYASGPEHPSWSGDKGEGHREHDEAPAVARRVGSDSA